MKKQDLYKQKILDFSSAGTERSLNVSIAPFIHSKNTFANLQNDFFAVYLLALIILCFSEPVILIPLIVVFSGLLSSKILLRLISDYQIGNIYFMLKSLILSSAASLLAINNFRVIHVYFAAFFAGIIYETIVKKMKFLPEFILIIILMNSPLKNNLTNMQILMFSLLICYLILKRRLSFWVFFAYLSSSVLIKYMLNIQYVWPDILVSSLYLGYPGILPEKYISKILYVLFCALALALYGIWGFIIMIFLGHVFRFL